MSAVTDNMGATVDTRAFTYDQAGNLLTATNAAGTYTRTYDELGRLETQSGLWGVDYAFDYNDRERTGVTDSLGGDTEWVRDDAGRVTRRTFTDGTDELRIDLGYNARDERTSETRYADVGGTTLVGTTVRGYDDAGNLTGLHYKDAGAATISNYVNAFDAADRITSETRNGGAPVTFSYDTTSQLTADSAAAYSYDLAGNRTMAGYATGASNRITSDGTWAFSYDDEGNVTKRSKGALAETWTYGYDHDNQMVWAEQRATDGGVLLMRLDFTYDVFSQRVREEKTVGATTTERRYTFADRGEVEAELDDTDAQVTRYLRGEAAGELWGRVGAGGAEWLLQDRLGSLRDVADASGAGVDHIDYNGFGNVLVETAPGLTGDFTFTGLWRQRETGLFHAFWRDYGASWGGWMQDDPIHIEGGGDPNVRRYCGNNPTNGTDLSGLRVRPGDPLNRETTDLAIFLAGHLARHLRESGSGQWASPPGQSLQRIMGIPSNPFADVSGLQGMLMWGAMASMPDMALERSNTVSRGHVYIFELAQADNLVDILAAYMSQVGSSQALANYHGPRHRRGDAIFMDLPPGLSYDQLYTTSGAANEKHREKGRVAFCILPGNVILYRWFKFERTLKADPFPRDFDDVRRFSRLRGAAAVEALDTYDRALEQIRTPLRLSLRALPAPAPKGPSMRAMSPAEVAGADERARQLEEARRLLGPALGPNNAELERALEAIRRDGAGIRRALELQRLRAIRIPRAR